MTDGWQSGKEVSQHMYASLLIWSIKELATPPCIHVGLRQSCSLAKLAGDPWTVQGDGSSLKRVIGDGRGNGSEGLMSWREHLLALTCLVSVSLTLAHAS